MAQLEGLRKTPAPHQAGPAIGRAVLAAARRAWPRWTPGVSGRLQRLGAAVWHGRRGPVPDRPVWFRRPGNTAARLVLRATGRSCALAASAPLPDVSYSQKLRDIGRMTCAQPTLTRKAGERRMLREDRRQPRSGGGLCRCLGTRPRVKINVVGWFCHYAVHECRPASIPLPRQICVSVGD